MLPFVDRITFSYLPKCNWPRILTHGQCVVVVLIKNKNPTSAARMRRTPNAVSRAVRHMFGAIETPQYIIVGSVC